MLPSVDSRATNRASYCNGSYSIHKTLVMDGQPTDGYLRISQSPILQSCDNLQEWPVTERKGLLEASWWWGWRKGGGRPPTVFNILCVLGRLEEGWNA